MSFNVNSYRPTAVVSSNYTRVNSSRKKGGSGGPGRSSSSTGSANNSNRKNISFSGTGKLATSVFSNVIMWLCIGLIAYLGFRFISPLLKLWTRNLTPTASDAVDRVEEEISKHSSDRMSNGDTYMRASVFLYHEMFGEGFFPWWKKTDHNVVGRYILTVMRTEFSQLSSTYRIYKVSQTSFYEFSDMDTLLDDLKSLLSSEEQVLYLRHLELL
jgi:hypothetical protein